MWIHFNPIIRIFIYKNPFIYKIFWMIIRVRIYTRKVKILNKKSILKKVFLNTRNCYLLIYLKTRSEIERNLLSLKYFFIYLDTIFGF